MYFWSSEKTAFWQPPFLMNNSFWLFSMCRLLANQLCNPQILLTILNGQVAKEFTRSCFTVNKLPRFFFPMMCYFLQFLLLLQLAFQACPPFHLCWGGREICKQIWKRRGKTESKINCWKQQWQTPRDRCGTHLRFDSYESVGIFATGHLSMNKPAKKTCLYDYLHYMPKTDCIKLPVFC